MAWRKSRGSLRGWTQLAGGVCLGAAVTLSTVFVTTTAGAAPTSTKAKHGKAAKPGKAQTPGGPVVSFVGLQVHADKSAQLWVEMNQKGDVSVSRQGATLVFLVRDASIQTKNNENPLRAEHFGANVLSAKLDRTKDGVTFTVRLRTPTEAVYRVVEQPSGAVLQVDVPKPLESKTSG
ncbi:MAG TPA: hypothetical protein VLC09_12755 [Polyangiaceae bacterium]|nr:hypothetical protein [Polyangiaceae bacterium]